MCQCLVRKSRRRGRYGEYVVTRRGGWWVRLGLGLEVGLEARLGLGLEVGLEARLGLGLGLGLG